MRFEIILFQKAYFSEQMTYCGYILLSFQNIIVSVLSRSCTYISSERFTERKLFYLEHGQPVILIHGTLNDFRVWQLSHLHKNFILFQIVDDMRTQINGLEMGTNNATDLAELIIQRLDLGPAHFIGHSYGALNALYMAYQHPELVRTLVLGEPPVMSLLENHHKYSKDVDTIRRNAFEPAQDAIRRGETERAVRYF